MFVYNRSIEKTKNRSHIENDSVFNPFRFPTEQTSTREQSTKKKGQDAYVRRTYLSTYARKTKSEHDTRCHHNAMTKHTRTKQQQPTTTIIVTQAVPPQHHHSSSSREPSSVRRLLAPPRGARDSPSIAAATPAAEVASGRHALLTKLPLLLLRAWRLDCCLSRSLIATTIVGSHLSVSTARCCSARITVSCRAHTKTLVYAYMRTCVCVRAR